jgi:signal transduction histidine kinase
LERRDQVAVVAHAVGLLHAAGRIVGHRHGAVAGAERVQALAVPLDHGGGRIGSPLITPRTVGGSLTPAERQLLENRSSQVALTAHAVELSRGLQRSREQLVAAREEERRRLRRDLHDGLGPAPAAITVSADAARNPLERDPARATACSPTSATSRRRRSPTSGGIAADARPGGSLRSMRERADEAGRQCAGDAVAGGGPCVHVRLPMG